MEEKTRRLARQLSKDAETARDYFNALRDLFNAHKALQRDRGDSDTEAEFRSCLDRAEMLRRKFVKVYNALENELKLPYTEEDFGGLTIDGHVVH